MPPRPASTVILVRDGADGVETYLIRRASTMAFAPRMHVYPGGRVDEADYRAPIVFTDEDDVDRLAARLSTDVAGVRALYSCAIREVEEEVGVVLVAPDGDGVLRVDPSTLPLADHWVTPDVEVKRYDVRFFIAEIPVGQEARLRTSEADDAFWVRPADALAGAVDGAVALLPPTQVTLRYVAGFPTAADAVAQTARRAVIPLIPRRLARDDGTHRWAIVNDRTGDIVVDDVRAPHLLETDGVQMPEHLR